jgi:hypothetical protein
MMARSRTASWSRVMPPWAVICRTNSPSKEPRRVCARNAASAQNARQQVLSAYDGYISGYKDITGPAETVVFLAPPPYTDNNAAGENKNVETIADRFPRCRHRWSSRPRARPGPAT